MSRWVPTLEDAERFVREKEARDHYTAAMARARIVMREAYFNSPEYRKIQRRVERAQKVEKKRQAAFLKRREAELAEQKARWDEEQRIRKEQRARREANAAKKAAALAATPDREGRERMSRVDWLEVFGGDKQLANRQVAWERRATALRMRQAGMTYAEIGRRLSHVCRGRAQQMVAHAERERKHNSRTRRSPAEIWMTEQKVNPDQKLRWFTKPSFVVMPPHNPETDWIWAGLAA